MRTTKLILAAAVVFALGVTAAPARNYRHCAFNGPGSTTYWGYPYSHSYGYRVDPYWSYSSTRQPYAYQGDGSYYGLGYSGYSGDGAAGNYWYW
jgi:hypothetical protein